MPYQKGTPVVLVVRNFDGPNDIDVYDTDAYVINCDLGYLDLGDPREFEEWAASMQAAIDPLPSYHPARTQIEEFIHYYAEKNK